MDLVKNLSSNYMSCNKTFCKHKDFKRLKLKEWRKIHYAKNI